MPRSFNGTAHARRSLTHHQWKRCGAARKSFWPSTLDAGTRALVKFAVGSQKLYKEINLEEYLRQLDDGREGIGRYSELLHTHPYVPKRVEALRLFAQSAVFLKAMGEGGGLPKDDVDRRVAELVAVLGQGKKKAAAGSTPSDDETGSNDAG